MKQHPWLEEPSIPTHVHEVAGLVLDLDGLDVLIEHGHFANLKVLVVRMNRFDERLDAFSHWSGLAGLEPVDSARGL